MTDEITRTDHFVITDVKISLLGNKPVGEALAFAHITLDNVLIVRGLKVLKMHTGDLRVMMPDRKTGDGEYVCIVSPNNQATRKYIEDCVLEAYNDKLEREARKPAALAHGGRR